MMFMGQFFFGLLFLIVWVGFGVLFFFVVGKDFGVLLKD